MAAYAGLVSLKNIMDQITNHSFLSISVDKNQIESLAYKVNFLLDFMETAGSEEARKVNFLLDFMETAGSEEARVLADQILVGSTKEAMNSSIEQTSSVSLRGLRKLVKDIKRKVSKPRHQLMCGPKDVTQELKVEDQSGFHQVISKQVLESQIAFAAYEAEDVIESHVVDQIQGGSISLLNLRAVTEDMEDIMRKVMEFKEESRSRNLHPAAYSLPTTSSRHVATANRNTMVGFDEQLIQLMDRLTGEPSSHQIISVVGMGGIGKTTLVKHAYEHTFIAQHFDIRTWVTVSQKYNIREIILQLLSWQSKPHNETDRETEDQLGERLYKRLSGWRYLIVVDDIWSIEAWDKIKLFFPNNSNGSRIVVTTRISDVATHFRTPCLELSFLDEDKSWELFCDKAFGQACCPPQLEDIGKEIARRCKGLPLSIICIAGLLGRSNKSQEYWGSIAKDLISILNSGEGEDDCLNILSLSYTHLSAHLKPCILYMGIFPEDHEISVSRLLKLWIAEGFIRLNKSQSLEDTARGYLNDLIDRNLILKHKLGSNGKIKFCKMHDLLRDLCLKVAQKDKFISMMEDIPQHIHGDRRLVFNERVIPENQYQNRGVLFPGFGKKKWFRVRTLAIHTSWSPLSLSDRLLRVFDLFDESVDGNIDKPKNISDRTYLWHLLGQVNLRYLAYRCKFRRLDVSDGFRLSASLLWNMQTLIIGASIDAPPEIWEMRQLRHVDINLLRLPQPPPSGQLFRSVLPNLQTLKTVINFTWSDEPCKRVGNVKKLNIKYDDYAETTSDYCLYNIGCLRKLESLTCSYARWNYKDDLVNNLKLPSSLKKLSLTNCKIHWENLTRIGSLPNLEVLKLGWGSALGLEWNPVEGEFVRLKFLLIQSSNLVCWNAGRYHFPVLEKLVLQRLGKLDEIPLDIGEIPTLGFIHVDCCSESAGISAFKIAEEQESVGNEGLQVVVEFDYEAEVKSFREKVGLESFTSNSFRVKANIPSLEEDEQ